MQQEVIIKRKMTYGVDRTVNRDTVGNLELFGSWLWKWGLAADGILVLVQLQGGALLKRLDNSIVVWETLHALERSNELDWDKVVFLTNKSKEELVKSEVGV